jgi:hypothetical protein
MRGKQLEAAINLLISALMLYYVLLLLNPNLKWVIRRKMQLLRYELYKLTTEKWKLEGLQVRGRFQP